jgi:hypothetical protein
MKDQEEEVGTLLYISINPLLELCLNKVPGHIEYSYEDLLQRVSKIMSDKNPITPDS